MENPFLEESVDDAMPEENPNETGVSKDSVSDDDVEKPFDYREKRVSTRVTNNSLLKNIALLKAPMAYDIPQPQYVSDLIEICSLAAVVEKDVDSVKIPVDPYSDTSLDTVYTSRGCPWHCSRGKYCVRFAFLNNKKTQEF